MTRIIVNHSQGENIISFTRFFAFCLLILGLLGGIGIFTMASEVGSLAVVWGITVILNAGLVFTVLLVLAYIAENLGYLSQNTPEIVPKDQEKGELANKHVSEESLTHSDPENSLVDELVDATTGNDEGTCRELLARGADPNEKGRNGFSAHDIARARSYSRLLKLFNSHQSN